MKKSGDLVIGQLGDRFGDFDVVIHITTSPNHKITKSVDGERRAAAAGRGRVGVLDREPAAGHRIDEVDLSTLEITDADGIDEQPHAVRLEHLIPGSLPVLFNHQAVLEARAAAALHEYPEAAAGLVFINQQLADFGRRRFGYVDHVTLFLLESPSL